MFKRHKLGVFAVITVVIAFTLVGARAYKGKSTGLGYDRGASSQTSLSPPTPQTRNLFLRAETRRVVRSIGQRLGNRELQTSTIAGTFTIKSENHLIQVNRLQRTDGEQIEIILDGSRALTWDSMHGIQVSGRTISDEERDLVERLVFDSPDQFILAQLRGASYYTVARYVRPTGAPDDYSGPLWDVVRVSDSAESIGKDRAAWRLYYINLRTGLIDKIKSEVAGQPITATLTWSRQADENFPSRIVWTRQGQPFMEFDVSGFSVNLQ